MSANAAEYMRAWRAAHPGYANEHNKAARDKNAEHYREVEAAWREENRGDLRESSRAWRERHPEYRVPMREWDQQNKEKKRAHTAVRSALKAGLLLASPCEVCGSPAESHHDDYSKPLDVRWLCRKHHMETRDDCKAEMRRKREAK